MKKNMMYLLFILFSLILIGVVTFVLRDPAWRSRTSVQGIYIAEENQLFRLNFSVNSRAFWIIYTDINVFDGEQEVTYYGHYILYESNHFVFEGDNIGGFESFSIINRNLDIEVIINGEAHIFEHRDNVPSVTADFDPTFLESN